MKKKLLAVSILSVGMLFSTIACNPNGDQPTDDDDDDHKTDDGGKDDDQPDEDKDTSIAKTCKEANEIASKLASKGVTADTYKLTGTVTSVVSKSFTIQDSTGGFYVYLTDSATTTTPSIGNKVEVKAKLTKMYSGLLETTGDDAKITVLSETGDTYEPINVTSVSELTEDKQSLLIKVDGLILTSLPKTSATSSYDVNCTLNGDKALIRVDKHNADLTNLNTFFDGIKIGQEIKVKKAILGWYNNPQFSALSASDFEAGEYVDVASIELKEGESALTTKAMDGSTLETFDISSKVVVSPANATNKAVSYSSSDASVASVSDAGIITAKKEGSATITVISKANSEKTCTLSVTVTGTSSEEVTTTYTIDVSADDFTDSWGSSSDIHESHDITKNNITIGLHYTYKASGNKYIMLSGKSNTSWLGNSTAFGKKITKVEIHSGKSGTLASGGHLRATFLESTATAGDTSTEESQNYQTTTNETDKAYTFEPLDDTSYPYFSLTATTKNFQMSSLIITYVE